MTTITTTPTRSLILDAVHGIIRRQNNRLFYVPQRSALALEASPAVHQPAELWETAFDSGIFHRTIQWGTGGDIAEAQETWIVVTSADLLTTRNIVRTRQSCWLQRPVFVGGMSQPFQFYVTLERGLSSTGRRINFLPWMENTRRLRRL